MEFWDILYLECKKNNITLNKLAEMLNISGAAISKWRKGSQPTADKIIAISNILNISSDCLLGIDPKYPGLTEDQQELLNNYNRADNYGKQQIRTLAKSEAERNEKEME